MKPLIYEAILHSLNGATADFEFEADSVALAKDHAQTLANCGTEGYEWNKPPDWMKCIEIRRKGLDRFKTIHTTRQPVKL